MKFKFLLAPLMTFILWIHSATSFTTPAVLANIPFKVGIVDIPPFSQYISGHPSGIAVDIWNSISKENNFATTYVDIGTNLDAAIKKIYSGELDALIGPVGIIASRAKNVYFTVPYYQDHYVLIAKEHKLNILDEWSLLNVIFNRLSSALAILIFLGLYVLYIHLFWYLERKRQEDLCELNYRRGIETLFWRSLMNRTVQAAPYFPKIRLTRVITIIWSVTCMILFFYIFAGLTASLVSSIANAGKTIRQLSDVNNRPIAIYGWSSTRDTAAMMGLNSIANLPTIQNNIALLEKGDVAGVYMFKPFAMEYLKTLPKTDLYITPIKFPLLSLGFILSDNNVKFLKQINSSILQITESGEKMLICRKYEKDVSGEHCM